MMRRLRLWTLTVLAAGCGAWDASAPPAVAPKECPKFDAAIDALRGHVNQGGTSHLEAWLVDSHDDLKAALLHAAPLSGEDAERASVAPPAETTATVQAIWNVLLPDTDALQTSHHPAVALYDLSKCVRTETLKVLDLALGDERAPSALDRLWRATMRSKLAKVSELKAVGLDQEEAFVSLGALMLKSLVNPPENPETLISLLQGLSGPDGDSAELLSALADVLLVLVTTPDGLASDARRTTVAEGLACLEQDAQSTSVPSLLYRSLVLLDAPDTAVRRDTHATSVDVVALRAFIHHWIDRPDGVDALRRVGMRALRPPEGQALLEELRVLTSGPLGQQLLTLVELFTGTAACDDDGS